MNGWRWWVFTGVLVAGLGSGQIINLKYAYSVDEKLGNHREDHVTQHDVEEIKALIRQCEINRRDDVKDIKDTLKDVIRKTR